MSALIAIERPNGRLYRPRKVEARISWNEDGPVWLVVFGTHDVTIAETYATEALDLLHREDEDLRPHEVYRVKEARLDWLGTSPGWDHDADRMIRFYKHDEASGRACVIWSLAERVREGYCPDCLRAAPDHAHWCSRNDEIDSTSRGSSS